MNPFAGMRANPFYVWQRRGAVPWLGGALALVFPLVAYGALAWAFLFPSDHALALLGVFAAVASVASFLAAFVPPALLADCLAREKQERTLDWVILSGYPAERVLGGKLYPRLRWLALALLFACSVLVAAPILFHSRLARDVEWANRNIREAASGSAEEPPAGAHRIEGYEEDRQVPVALLPSHLDWLLLALVLAAVAHVLSLLVLSTGVAFFASSLARTSTSALALAYGTMLVLPSLLCGCVSYTPSAMLSIAVFGTPGGGSDWATPLSGILIATLAVNALTNLLIGGGLLFATKAGFEGLNLR